MLIRRRGGPLTVIFVLTAAMLSALGAALPAAAQTSDIFTVRGVPV